MKHTKFLFVLLAVAMACTFAACSDEEQDVNVVSDTYTTNTYYYKVTGTYTTGTNDTPANTSYTIIEDFAYVSWSTARDENARQYTIKDVSSSTNVQPYYYATIDATTPIQASLKLQVSVYEKDGTYYISRSDYNTEGKPTSGSKWHDASSNITGSLEGDSFTYTYSDPKNNGRTLNLTFTKVN